MPYHNRQPLKKELDKELCAKFRRLRSAKNAGIYAIDSLVGSKKLTETMIKDDKREWSRRTLGFIDFYTKIIEFGNGLETVFCVELCGRKKSATFWSANRRTTEFMLNFSAERRKKTNKHLKLN